MSEEETERREKRNRARLEALVHASEELLQRLLRDAFSAKHRRVKWDGGAGVAAAYPRLTATLKPIQRKQLTAGDAGKWDLTLLHAVLLCVVTGKSKTARTQRQAISKIVNVRNLCAHAAGGRVEDAAFATHAQTIEAAYVALGGDRDAIQAALRQADADGDAPLPTYDERATQEALSHKRDGNAAFAQQDFHDARRIYSRGLDVEGAVDPRVLAELHSNRSSACCRLRDFASAKIDARRAAELAPMWPKPHARLGELWVAQGKHRKAVASFETALRLARAALTGDGDTASGRALLASVERQVASARLLVDKDDRRESEDLAYDSQFRSEGAYREALQARMGLASSHDPNEIARAFVSLDLEQKEGFGNMKQVVNAHLALQDGRLHDAARGFLAAAVAGNAEGMYNYAVMVSNGRGVATDIAQAVEWLEKAAAMTPSPSRDARHLNIGIGEAMASLGRYYDLGIHFKQSDSKAVEYWEKAARMGVAAGLNSLATCYMDGHHGMRQDLAKARDLLRPSAEKLQNEAMTNLAVVHAAIQDFSTAARWAATAARFGYMPALQMAAEYKRQSAHDAKATANWDLLRSISRLQRGHWENSDAGPVVDVFRPTLVDLRAIGTPYATRLANALSQLTEAKLLISRGQLKAGLDLAAKALRVPHALGLLTDDQEEFFATASRELVKRGQPIDTTLTVFMALNSSQFALDCANNMRRRGLYDPVVVQLAAVACFHSDATGVAESIALFQYALTKVPHPEQDEDPATMQLLFDLANAYFVSEQHDAASRFASRFLAVAVADGHRLASEVHFMLGIITVVQASEAKRKKRSEELKTVALTHLRDGLVLSANLPECFREGSKSMAQRMLEMAAVLESPCPELLASDTSSFEDLTQRGGELVFGHRRHPALIRSESDPADDFRLVDSWRKKGAEWGNLMQREEKGRLSKTMTMMPPAMSSARVAQGPLRPASVDELLSGLQDRVYSDRRLDAIVVAEAYFTGASYSLIVEDSQREPVRLAVYNASGQFIKQLAPGRVISLRSPYVRITQEGEIMIRVERPDVAIQLEGLFVVCWACSLHLTSAPQIRCSHCSTARYCSEQCKARDWEVYGHQYWCSRTIDDDAGAPVSSKKKKKKKQKKEKKVKPEQVESAPVGRETEPLVESSENQLNILVEPLPETELLDESCETQLDTPAEPQPFAVARDPNTVKPPQSDCCIS